jgi:hypothetical protein
MPEGGERQMRLQTKKLTLCAMISALGVMIMIMGGLTGVGTYAAPILSGVVLIPIIDEYGLKCSLACWVATGILGLILVSEKELALFYACVVGWYTCLKSVFDRLTPVIRWVVKAVTFNAAVIAMYGVLFAVIGMENAGFGKTWMVILSLVLGNVVFILYDRGLTVLTDVYKKRLRSRIFKGRQERP